MLAIKIDRRTLEQELASMIDRPVDRPIAFELGLDVATGRGAEWLHLARTLATAIGRDQSLLRHPLVVAPLVEGLLAGLLVAAEHEFHAELALPVTNPGPAIVRRARAHIEEHADEPLTVSALARQVGISTRALQYGFQRTLGSAPGRVIRDTRLRRAHHELLAAAADEITVREVAARWGFLHPGRFAADYRARYGVSPSVTLRAR
jgi:AraC-like DNA-binding protein